MCRVHLWLQLNEMATELEDQRELATSRLTELEKLQQDHQEAVKEIETLKMDVRDVDCHYVTIRNSILLLFTDIELCQSTFCLCNEYIPLLCNVI